jgi:hypothetical protein
MAEVAEFIVQCTGVIEKLDDGTLRYVHRMGSVASDCWREFGVCVPPQSLQLFKEKKHYMQDGQLWRETENFVEKIRNSEYTLPQSFPDFILREDVVQKLLNGSDLTLEDVQNSVVQR